MSSRPHYYATDDVCYRTDSSGFLVLTTLESPLPPGWQQSVARTAADKELVWERINQQEKRHAESLTEALYKQREGRIKELRSRLEQDKLSAGVTQAELDFIRAGLEVLDRKEDALNKHSAFGIAAMQEHEAPLPAACNEKVTIPDAQSN